MNWSLQIHSIYNTILYQVDRPQWWVYHTEEQIEALIQSLNKRGIRESELRQSLELDKDNIIQYLRKCPVKYLNGSAASVSFYTYYRYMNEPGLTRLKNTTGHYILWEPVNQMLMMISYMIKIVDPVNSHHHCQIYWMKRKKEQRHRSRRAGTITFRI